jgi:hypothetical protein
LPGSPGLIIKWPLTLAKEVLPHDHKAIGLPLRQWPLTLVQICKIINHVSTLFSDKTNDNEISDKLKN